MDAFMFFNSGFNAGASIMHKHMQVIPYSSMNSPGGLVPTEEAALNYLQNNKVESDTFTLPQFRKFKHIFHKIGPEFFEKVSESEAGANEMSENL